MGKETDKKGGKSEAGMLHTLRLDENRVSPHLFSSFIFFCCFFFDVDTDAYAGYDTHDSFAFSTLGIAMLVVLIILVFPALMVSIYSVPLIDISSHLVFSLLFNYAFFFRARGGKRERSGAGAYACDSPPTDKPVGRSSSGPVGQSRRQIDRQTDR